MLPLAKLLLSPLAVVNKCSVQSTLDSPKILKQTGLENTEA